MLRKNAFTINEDNWTIVATYDADDGKGRKIVDVAIGTEGEAGEQKYITEPFYKDVLPAIFKNAVTVHLNLYADPQVIIEANGKLVQHNDDLPGLKKCVKKAIEDVSQESNRIRTMTDVRMNKYNGQSLSHTAKILRDNVTAAMPKGMLFDGKKLNIDFLTMVLREEFGLDTPVKKDTIEGILRQMSKAELVNIQGELLEYNRTGTSKFSPLKELIADGHSAEEIHKAFSNELERRFFSGEIY